MSSWLAVLAGRFCRPLCLCRVPCPRWPANYYPADWQADGAKAGPDKADINTAQFDAICIKVVPIQRSSQENKVKLFKNTSSKSLSYPFSLQRKTKTSMLPISLFHILKSSFLSSTPPGCCLILFSWVLQWHVSPRQNSQPRMLRRGWDHCLSRTMYRYIYII